MQCFRDVIPMGRPAWIRQVTIRLISNVFFFFSIYLFFVYTYFCTDMYDDRYGDMPHITENSDHCGKKVFSFIVDN